MRTVKIGSFIATFLLSASFMLVAQPVTFSHGRIFTTPASGIDSPGDAGVRAHTNVEIATTMSGAPQVVGPPFPGYFYETPASIACIYLFELQPQVSGCNPNVTSHNPDGGSRAIAIVAL